MSTLFKGYFMSIKEFLKKNNLTLRDMAVMCDVHHTTLYRLSLPRSHKSSRGISLAIARKIIKGTKGQVTLTDLEETA